MYLRIEIAKYILTSLHPQILTFQIQFYSHSMVDGGFELMS